MNVIDMSLKEKPLAPAAATLFECRGLSSFYGRTEIIKNVNLSIEDRCVTAFMGPSGCGKSTILRSLNRMHETAPDAHIKGDVLFDGRSIYAPDVDPTEVRTRIGMVFQKPNPFPKSIYDNVAFGPRTLGLIQNRSELDGRVEQALKRVGLWQDVADRLKESALGLSGGQQQRLVIARAIAVEPRAILFDEPCSALDPAATAKVEELIHELRANYCVVIVTHSLAQARRVADRVAFFHYGEMIEAGPPEKLLEDPDDQRVKDYLSGKTG